MRIKRLVRTGVFASALVSVVCVSAQPQEAPLAAEQQAVLATELLSGDAERRNSAVSMAAALGPSRVSEDVRNALITLLEQLTAQAESAYRSGAATATVVNPESLMAVARVVSDLRDVRAIPALSRVAYVGYSQHVVRGLASFGEQALLAIVAVIEDPSVNGDVVANSMEVLSLVVTEAGPSGLSQDARNKTIAVARRGLSDRHLLTVLSAVDLAAALNEPELVRVVTRFSRFSEGRNELRGRGLGDAEIEMIRKDAALALAKTRPAGTPQ
jgi:hypothetical protein